MAISPHRAKQKSKVRSSILTAAWRIAQREGWQTLSIRKIASAIQYSVPVVYDHFESKQAILSEFTTQGYMQLGESLLGAKTKSKKAAKQLELLAYAYWDFALNNPAYYQLMFGLGIPGCERILSSPELLAFTDIIKNTIAEAAHEAGNKKVNSILKLHVFWSTIHGLVSISSMSPATSRMGMSQEQLNKLVLKDFIKGFIKGLEI